MAKLTVTKSAGKQSPEKQIESALQSLPAASLRDILRQLALQDPLVAYELRHMALLSSHVTDRAPYVELLLTITTQLHALFSVQVPPPEFRQIHSSQFHSMSMDDFFGARNLDTAFPTFPEVAITGLQRLPAPHKDNLATLTTALLAVLEAELLLSREQYPGTGPNTHGAPPPHLALTYSMLLTVDDEASAASHAGFFYEVLDLLTSSPYRGQEVQTLLFQLAGELALDQPKGQQRVMAACDELIQRLPEGFPAPAKGRTKKPALFPTANPEMARLQAHANLLSQQALLLDDAFEEPLAALAVLKPHVGMHFDVRRNYVARLLQQRMYEETVSLARSWIGPKAPAWAAHEVMVWATQLQVVGQLTNNKELIREGLLRQLLEATKGVIYHHLEKPWRELRATYSPKEWVKVRPELEDQLLNTPGLHKHVRNSLKGILTQSDRYTDRQLALIQTQPTWPLVQEFGVFWLPDRVEELLQLYRRTIPAFLEAPGQTQRQDYETIATKLQVLMLLPGGDEGATELALELATKFKRRRNLLEALESVGFQTTTAKTTRPPVDWRLGNGDDEDEPAPRRLRSDEDIIPPRRGSNVTAKKTRRKK